MQVYLQRGSRGIYITNHDLVEHIPAVNETSNFGNATYDELAERIHEYQRTIGTRTAYPRASLREPRPLRSRYANVTAQYATAMGSPYGQPLHQRGEAYNIRQRFLFHSNVQEQFQRYATTPAFDYSEASATLFYPPDQPPDDDSTGDDEYQIPLTTTSRSQCILQAHHRQQEIQLNHLRYDDNPSGVATTILAMNDDALLATTSPETGVSSFSIPDSRLLTPPTAQ